MTVAVVLQTLSLHNKLKM